jgi:hypothetical protein
MRKAARRPEYLTFLQLLRESREEKGVTVKELARRLGQAPSHIEACESGADCFGRPRGFPSSYFLFNEEQ